LGREQILSTAVPKTSFVIKGELIVWLNHARKQLLYLETNHLLGEKYFLVPYSVRILIAGELHFNSELTD
jgi:hypothetical protein